MLTTVIYLLVRKASSSSSLGSSGVDKELLLGDDYKRDIIADLERSIIRW